MPQQACTALYAPPLCARKLPPIHHAGAIIWSVGGLVLRWSPSRQVETVQCVEGHDIMGMASVADQWLILLDDSGCIRILDTAEDFALHAVHMLPGSNAEWSQEAVKFLCSLLENCDHQNHQSVYNSHAWMHAASIPFIGNMHVFVTVHGIGLLYITKSSVTMVAEGVFGPICCQHGRVLVADINHSLLFVPYTQNGADLVVGSPQWAPQKVPETCCALVSCSRTSVLALCAGEILLLHSDAASGVPSVLSMSELPCSLLCFAGASAPSNGNANARSNGANSMYAVTRDGKMLNIQAVASNEIEIKCMSDKVGQCPVQEIQHACVISISGRWGQDWVVAIDSKGNISSGPIGSSPAFWLPTPPHDNSSVDSNASAIGISIAVLDWKNSISSLGKPESSDGDTDTTSRLGPTGSNGASDLQTWAAICAKDGMVTTSGFRSMHGKWLGRPRYFRLTQKPTETTSVNLPGRTENDLVPGKGMHFDASAVIMLQDSIIAADSDGWLWHVGADGEQACLVQALSNCDGAKVACLRNVPKLGIIGRSDQGHVFKCPQSLDRPVVHVFTPDKDSMSSSCWPCLEIAIMPSHGWAAYCVSTTAVAWLTPGSYSNKNAGTLDLNSVVIAMSGHPFLPIVACLDTQGCAQLIDLQGRACLGSVCARPGALDLCIECSGIYMAVLLPQGGVAVFETTTGDAVEASPVLPCIRNARVTAISFSPAKPGHFIFTYTGENSMPWKCCVDTSLRGEEAENARSVFAAARLDAQMWGSVPWDLPQVPGVSEKLKPMTKGMRNWLAARLKELSLLVENGSIDGSSLASELKVLSGQQIGENSLDPSAQSKQASEF